MMEILQILIFGLVLGGVYALMASGLTLVFGVMKIINLAHPILIIAGAYISYWLFKLLGWDPILSMPIGMICMFCVGVAVYKLIFQREAGNPKFIEMTVLLTFALALTVDGLLGFMFSNTHRVTSPSYSTEVFIIGELFIPKAQLYAGLLSIFLILVLWVFLKFSRIGYAIRATTQNRDAAQLIGVNVAFVSTITFGIGIALAGASGALVSFIFSFFPAKHWEWIAILMSLIVLGGMGSLLGAVLGSILLAVIAAFVGDVFGPTWSTMTFFLALFLILLIRPQGLFGEKFE